MMGARTMMSFEYNLATLENVRSPSAPVLFAATLLVRVLESFNALT